MFTSDFFRGNRERLLQATGLELIVIGSHGTLQRSADTTHGFRQNSNFWYVSGVLEPDFVAVIGKNEQFLIQPEREAHRDLWEGAIDVESLRGHGGFDAVYGHNEGWNKLDVLVKKVKKVGTILPNDEYLPVYGFYINPGLLAFKKRLKQAVAVHKLQDVRKALGELRQIKHALEIEAIKHAVSITIDGFETLRHSVANCKTEADVEALLSFEFAKRGAKYHAYTPIVASDGNAATIHYTDNNDDLSSKQLLLMDVGAEYSLYAADITRTYALKKPTPRIMHVYEEVRQLQHEMVAFVKPGIRMRDIEERTEALMGEALMRLKLISNTSKEAIRTYYPHGTSHFLGLDVHDAGNYDTPLPPHTILTIEPGIYIPDERIGIRIEDDVLITEKGHENLSGALSTNLLYYI